MLGHLLCTHLGPTKSSVKLFWTTFGDIFYNLGPLSFAAAASLRLGWALLGLSGIFGPFSTLFKNFRPFFAFLGVFVVPFLLANWWAEGKIQIKDFWMLLLLQKNGWCWFCQIFTLKRAKICKVSRLIELLRGTEHITSYELCMNFLRTSYKLHMNFLQNSYALINI